jgi:hypothetical protein
MGNPANDIPGRRQPPRADPVQPDKPFSGEKKDSPQAGSSGSEATTKRQKEQSDAALSNVRNDT